MLMILVPLESPFHALFKNHTVMGYFYPDIATHLAYSKISLLFRPKTRVLASMHAMVAIPLKVIPHKWIIK